MNSDYEDNDNDDGDDDDKDDEDDDDNDGNDEKGPIVRLDLDDCGWELAIVQLIQQDSAFYRYFFFHFKIRYNFYIFSSAICFKISAQYYWTNSTSYLHACFVKSNLIDMCAYLELIETQTIANFSSSTVPCFEISDKSYFQRVLSFPTLSGSSWSSLHPSPSYQIGFPWSGMEVPSSF